MVGWHQLNGHEFEEVLGGGELQESLECCSPWGHKELDTTLRLDSSHAMVCYTIVTANCSYAQNICISDQQTSITPLCDDIHYDVCKVYVVPAKSLQLNLTPCNPMDSSPSGSSVHETLQARILEWVAISFSRGSSQPRH